MIFIETGPCLLLVLSCRQLGPELPRLVTGEKGEVAYLRWGITLMTGGCFVGPGGGVSSLVKKQEI